MRRENSDRKKIHGTFSLGENVPGAKLSGEIVVDIRRRHANGEPARRLAADYGVHPVTIWAAIRGRYWGHVAALLDDEDPPVVFSKVDGALARLNGDK